MRSSCWPILVSPGFQQTYPKISMARNTLYGERRPRLAEKTIDGGHPILQRVGLAVDQPRGVRQPRVVELNLVEARGRRLTCHADVIGAYSGCGSVQASPSRSR
jgi:hypothetical protein